MLINVLTGLIRNSLRIEEVVEFEHEEKGNHIEANLESVWPRHRQLCDGLNEARKQREASQKTNAAWNPHVHGVSPTPAGFCLLSLPLLELFSNDSAYRDLHGFLRDADAQVERDHDEDNPIGPFHAPQLLSVVI